MRRRAIGHIIAIIAVVVLLIVVVAIITNYYAQKRLENTYVSGNFQGYTTVNTGNGDQYIVKIASATITCDSWTMNTADIYALTHLQLGQTVTMNLACSNIAVG